MMIFTRAFYGIMILILSSALLVNAQQSTNSTIDTIPVPPSPSFTPTSFNGGISHFDKLESLSYLFYGKASYCEKDTIADWSCGKSCDFHSDMREVEVLVNSTHNAQGFVGIDGNKLVIAFRGSTHSVSNWVGNFYILKTNYPDCGPSCQVHSGFSNAYNDIKEQLMASIHRLTVQNFDSKIQSIIITGHSLGAAIATLAAPDIHRFLEENQLPHRIIAIHTFGSPRVGNKAFVEYYNALFPQTVRVVHGLDVVPHVPPKFIGFAHVGTEVWITKGKQQEKNLNITNDQIDNEKNREPEVEDTYRVCTGLIEDPTCSSSIVKLSISQHLIYLSEHTGCEWGNNNGNSTEIQDIGDHGDEIDNDEVELTALNVSSA